MSPPTAIDQSALYLVQMARRLKYRGIVHPGDYHVVGVVADRSANGAAFEARDPLIKPLPILPEPEWRSMTKIFTMIAVERSDTQKPSPHGRHSPRDDR